MKEKIYAILQNNKYFRAFLQVKRGLPFPEEKRSTFSRLRIIFDYTIQYLTRNISVDEYFHLYKFYNLNRKARKEYFSNYEAHEFEAELNQVNAIAEFKDKACFNRIFSPFIQRDYVLAQEVSYSEFKVFLSNHQDILFKPNDSSMGRGIQKMNSREALDAGEDFYHTLRNSNYLCEQCLVAVDEIQQLHPASLNTVRVVTFCNHGVVKILWTFIRMGRNNNVIDNGHSGGIWAMIDSESGLVSTSAIASNGKRFLYHPDTNKQIKGILIPHWDDVIDTAIQAALHFPKAVICGWDIAILNDGSIEIIEGNSKPDLDMIQGALGQGIKTEFLRICKGM